MKIVMLTDNPLIPTGMGRVGREIALALHKGGHDITYIGWYKDAPQINDLPFEIIPVENASFGQTVFDDIVRSRRPDVVLTIGDPWMYKYIANPEQCRTRRLFQWVGYVAVDGECLSGGVPNFWKAIVGDMDKVIAYTEYGKNALMKTIPDFNDIDVIYHGVDEKIYHRYEDDERNKLRARLGLTDKFCFLVVARNCGRKNWPELFKAWKLVKENGWCKNGMLWPHTYFNDSAGVNIDELLVNFGLQETQSITFFNQVARARSSVDLIPEGSLASLYNACDCLVSVGGEGFGLPVIEAMASKLPVIVLNESATGELGAEDRSWLIEKSFSMTGKYLTERPIPNIEQLATMMKLVCDNDEVNKVRAEKAYEFAMNYTWEKIGRVWLDWFDKFEHPTKRGAILQEVC